jgi:hypothetical protein
MQPGAPQAGGMLGIAALIGPRFRALIPVESRAVR